MSNVLCNQWSGSAKTSSHFTVFIDFVSLCYPCSISAKNKSSVSDQLFFNILLHAMQWKTFLCLAQFKYTHRYTSSASFIDNSRTKKLFIRFRELLCNKGANKIHKMMCQIQIVVIVLNWYLFNIIMSSCTHTYAHTQLVFWVDLC